MSDFCTNIIPYRQIILHPLSIPLNTTSTNGHLPLFILSDNIAHNITFVLAYVRVA